MLLSVKNSTVDKIAQMKRPPAKVILPDSIPPITPKKPMKDTAQTIILIVFTTASQVKNATMLQMNSIKPCVIFILGVCLVLLCESVK